MKFGEMTEKQQEAIKQSFITVLTVKSQEEQRYPEQFFRLLVLGNGAGVALVATFMGALVRNNAQLRPLRIPVILFASGTVLAALVYGPLMTVANQATNFVFAQTINFFLDKKNLEEITGYSFNRRGRIVMYLLLFSSLCCFAVGAFKCVQVLGAL